MGTTEVIDDGGSDAEVIRLTAYFLWEQEGRPEGRNHEFWRRACEMHARQRAYDGLLAESPDDPPAERPADASGRW